MPESFKQLPAGRLGVRIDPESTPLETAAALALPEELELGQAVVGEAVAFGIGDPEYEGLAKAVKF